MEFAPHSYHVLQQSSGVVESCATAPAFGSNRNRLCSSELAIVRHTDDVIEVDATNVELRRITSKLPNDTSITQNKNSLAKNTSQSLSTYRHSTQALTTGKESNPHGNISENSSINLVHPNKMSKKQLRRAQTYMEKLNQINLHLNAVFAAVEHGHLDKACTILESTGVNVNSVNSDGFSLLDVSVLSNNRSMSKMLLQHGAIERSHNEHDFSNVGLKLKQLFKEAERRLHDIITTAEGPMHSATTSSSRPLLLRSVGDSGSDSSEQTKKEIADCERRLKALGRLLLGWEQARPPDSPSMITVDVIGDMSIKIYIAEPLEGAISTKFRVQWSTNSDFKSICGDEEILNWNSYHGIMGAKMIIDNLKKGQCYYIRAACGNMIGWGQFQTTRPASIKLSHWRELNNVSDRFSGQNEELDDLLTQFQSTRCPERMDLNGDVSGGQQKKQLKKKSSISLLRTSKHLFSATSKFQKNMKRGIYMACVVYCDDKVLVTNDDMLPVIEIDENNPANINNEYHWLMKVTWNWESVKTIRNDLERSQTSMVNQFRSRLLSAICQMQSLLGLSDLGLWHYQPLRDSQGTVVIVCVQSLRTQKDCSILNSRWMPHIKLQKKIVAVALDDFTVNEMLMSSIREQMLYHQLSMQCLETGLYLVYLKMQCSVDQMRLLVATDKPNFLPYCKMRDNRYVTAEEWQTLHISRTNINWDDYTEIQRKFLYDLSRSTLRLLAMMAVNTEEERCSHRIYQTEVIELNADISIIVMCPSAETCCAVTVTDTDTHFQSSKMLAISIQAFELANLRTFQPELWQKYSQLASQLDCEMAFATYMQREAFSKDEIELANERMNKLQTLTESLNIVWKRIRWLADIIAFARDRHAQSSGLSIKNLLDFAQSNGFRYEELEGEGCNAKRSVAEELMRHPLQMTKPNNNVRASWPSPTKSESANRSDVPQNLLSSHQMLDRHWTGCFSVTNCGIREGDCGTEMLLMRKHQNGAPINNFKAAKNTCCRFYSSNHELKRYQNSTTSTASFNMPLLKGNVINKTETHQQESQSAKTQCKDQMKPSATNVISVSNSKLEQGAPIPPSRSKTSIGMDEFLETKPLLDVTTQTHTVKDDEPKQAKFPIGLSTPRDPISSTISTVLSSSTSTTASEQNTMVSSGIIQVYTAYDTGLASGTSLKLHVTLKTSAREVINLVVKQLNMAATMKGYNGPIYTGDMMNRFCLVAVIGARERCLRDDFKLLMLQNPWKKGRLYVRQKSELLAAIEHANGKASSSKSFQIPKS